MTLGADTGGKALLMNDLSLGIVQAQRLSQLLHPRVLHQQLEPGRKIPAHQNFSRASGELDYRQGYFAYRIQVYDRR